VMGLVLAERDKDRAFLTTQVGLLAIELKKGDVERCSTLSFEVAPDSDFNVLARELEKEGISSELRNDSTPGIGPVLTFKDNKGTTIALFKEWSYLGKHLQHYGVGPLKLGHIAWVVDDPQKTAEFYEKVRVRLDRRFLRVYALQHRSPHGELHPRQQYQNAPHGLRAEGLHPPAEFLRPVRPAQDSDHLGTAAPRPRP
jgi:hypothetical protein